MTQKPGKGSKPGGDPSTRQGSVIAERYRTGRWQRKPGADVPGSHFPSNEEVAKEVQRAVADLDDTTKKYGHVAWFTLFVAAYMLVLYLQASTYRSAAVVATMRAALLPEGGSPRLAFTSSDQVLAYLGSKVVAPVWKDPACGDGKCEWPWEFPAFGRFGCRADCGLNPNSSTTVVAVSADFTGHPTLAAHMLADNAAWNLCLDDPQRRARGEQDLCWYEQDQAFDEVQSHTIQRMELTDGRWYVAVKGDLAGRVGGAVYRLAADGEPVQLATQPEWDTCSVGRRRSSAASSQQQQGQRRLMEDFTLAARLPEQRGRALLEASAQEVARQLEQLQRREQQRLAALQERVEERLAALAARAQQERVRSGKLQ